MASILGVASVWLLVRRNIWAFPIGILMVLAYSRIFYEARLYSDMLLQLVYVVLQVQGWMLWSIGGREADNKIRVLEFQRGYWVVSGLAVVVLALVLGWIMAAYTNAALPWVDALTTAISLVAQWWMNKRFVENWLMWVLADLIYLYQYSARGLYLTTLLYGLFLVMAIYGYRDWKSRVAAKA